MMRHSRLCRSVLVMNRSVGGGCKGRGTVGPKSSEKYRTHGKKRRNMEMLDMDVFLKTS